MPKGNRSLIISLECSICKERNYSTTKNKRTSQQDKLRAVEKFCSRCRKHTDAQRSPAITLRLVLVVL